MKSKRKVRHRDNGRHEIHDFTGGWVLLSVNRSRDAVYKGKETITIRNDSLSAEL